MAGIPGNTDSTRVRHVSLFGFRFDSVTLSEAVTKVLQLVEDPGSGYGHYVVTPNLDHSVLLYQRPELAEVYQSAELVIADGFPVIWASRWLRKPLPERVAGSDLVPGIFQATTRPLRVFLLGARPGVAQLAATKVEAQYTNVRVVGVHSPELGFEHDPALNDEAVRLVAETAPDVLVVALGAPKQELWSYRERHRLRAKVIICAGATVDFLAGERKRAPAWCQRMHLEWAYRALEEPGRLIPRYATDAVMFPRLVARELIEEYRKKSRSGR